MAWIKLTDPAPGVALRAWRASLDGDRGGRAGLRRCRTAAEVAFEPAFHRLLRALRAHGEVRAERVLPVAAVLAHLENDEPTKEIGRGRAFARRLAAPREGGNRSRFSELRLKGLLAVDDEAGLIRAFTRALAITDRTACAVDLADLLHRWPDDHDGRLKRDFAFAYFDAAAPKARDAA